jgi:hypothetical protein
MNGSRIKIGGPLLGLLGVLFVIVAITSLQPPQPPKPHPILDPAQQTTATVLLTALPIVFVVLVIGFVLRKLYRNSTVDSSGRRILGGRMTHSVEGEIRQRAASDAFNWLICAMSIDVSAADLLDRQPLELPWWPGVALVIFGLASVLRRKQLT